MKIKGTADWYTAAVDRFGKKRSGVLLTYRRSLAGMSDKEIESIQQDLADKGVSTTLQSSIRDHTGIPAGTLYLQVEDEESVSKLERLWGQLGIELDPHRYDLYLSQTEKRQLADKIRANVVPAWDSFLAWDIMQVAKRGGEPVTACRINLDHFDAYEQEKLKVRLTELGILGEERKATGPSESVKPGDLTFRVSPECVQRLESLFADRPKAKMDWRNLNNWDSSKELVDGKGAKVPQLRFCNKDMSPAEQKHLEKSLTACRIPWAIEAEKDGDFVRVLGVDNVQKLSQLLDPWTPKQSKTRTYLASRGDR